MPAARWLRPGSPASRSAVRRQAISERVRSLDLIRGIAVMGILAVNIAGFAGPISATLSPHLPDPASATDEASFAVVLLLFEGKMRMLFSMLFGASMMLFIERAEATGRNGDALQARRLGWLAVFGTMHYLLFWWGDILFAYAAIGTLALLLRSHDTNKLLTLAAMLFGGWVLVGLVATLGNALMVERIHSGQASPAELAEQAKTIASMIAESRDELIVYHGKMAAQLWNKMINHPWWLIGMAINNTWEILPMMLIGMCLQRTGFFAGAWRRSDLRRIARWGVGLGGGISALVIGWAWARHFPPTAMGSAIGVWLAVPHLLMALGYAAALALAAPRLLDTWLGRRLEASGRMAFSNYLGTTMVMTSLFYGWGLDLVGQVSETWQPLFVAFGWALMLAWSKPWLARYRQGPLEWAWRSLTEWHWLPNRRQTTIPG